MLIAKVNLEKYVNSGNSEELRPTNSVRGPVVVRVAIARTSASSNNSPNIERIIVTKAAPNEQHKKDPRHKNRNFKAL